MAAVPIIVSTIGSIAIELIKAPFWKMGNSAPAPAVDLGPIMDNHEKQMKALREEMSRSNEKDRKILEEHFKQKEESFQKLLSEIKTKNERLMSEVKSLEDIITLPSKNRKSAIEWVNSEYKSPVKTNKVMLLGLKASGKSTVLYLNGEGLEPLPDPMDGSTTVKVTTKYIDIVGLTGWDIHAFCKVMVLVCLTGSYPGDVVIFCTDRVYDPKLILAQFNILDPMIMVLQPNNFWSKFKPKFMNGRLREPTIRYQTIIRDGMPTIKINQDQEYELHQEDSEYYITDNGLGCVVKYNMIDRRSHERGSNCTSRSYDIVSSQFSEIMDPPKELFFRYLYIYLKKYKNRDNGQSLFMRSNEDIGPKMFD